VSQPRRVRFVGGVPFPVIEDEWPTRSGLVDFDGGARQLPPAPPRIEWTRDDGGWWTTTIDDSAAQLFPWARDR
jgi:hypothetical protein